MFSVTTCEVLVDLLRAYIVCWLMNDSLRVDDYALIPKRKSGPSSVYMRASVSSDFRAVFKCCMMIITRPRNEPVWFCSLSSVVCRLSLSVTLPAWAVGRSRGDTARRASTVTSVRPTSCYYYMTYLLSFSYSRSKRTCCVECGQTDDHNCFPRWPIETDVRYFHQTAMTDAAVNQMMRIP